MRDCAKSKMATKQPDKPHFSGSTLSSAAENYLEKDF
jgi:hypothetical protein